ncbi:MAG: 5-Nucleotidase protein [Ferruginibacter sp.]|nr:5-Nucleotidase protein [Ferruginibacter sp.]
MKQFVCILAAAFLTHPAAFSQTAADTVCILQLNDVYEIGALSHGQVGGMARVTTIVKQHEARYQTYVVLAGDFVSPSVIGTTTVEGQKVNGKQMVDMMNLAGVDLVTFGNHEFDIPDSDLQQRINESHFDWVSSDVLHKDTTKGIVSPYYKIKPDSVAIPTSVLLHSAHGQFTIGIISATLPSNPQPWVVYNDYLQSFKKAWEKTQPQSDVVIGLTHLALDSDRHLLRELIHVPLIMGGHEHKHNLVTVGEGVIAKADANAKTIYRHLLFRDGASGKIKVVSELLPVDSTVMPDPLVDAAVKVWEEKAYAAFRKLGLEPDSVVYHIKVPLDGTEEHVRTSQTNLGSLIAQAMLAAAPTTQAAIFNSGSIRIDDMIEGVMTELDVIRTLPFGGKLYEIELTGAVINRMLTVSESLKTSGGYLQHSKNISFDSAHARGIINGVPVKDAKTYRIVGNDYLFSGKEKGKMDFLKEGAPGIISIQRFTSPGDLRADLRVAVVKYLAGLEVKQGLKGKKP